MKKHDIMNFWSSQAEKNGIKFSENELEEIYDRYSREQSFDHSPSHKDFASRDNV